MSLIFPIKPSGNCAMAPCSGTDMDWDLCPRDRQGLMPNPHPVLAQGPRMQGTERGQPHPPITGAAAISSWFTTSRYSSVGTREKQR